MDESPKERFDSPQDEVTSVPDVITDLVLDAAIPGVSGPVRRNLLKALDRLCSATIDLPVAYLSGKADERRAETAARIKLIRTSTAQIAEQMRTDPEYARVAAQKFGNRVLREQVNLDMISQRAANEIRDPSSQSGPQESDDTIDDDWLNAFETEARQKSTEEMQDMFGKILAGEIRNPGRYSTRTIRILASLDQGIASHFATFCSMCLSSLGDVDVRVVSMGGNAASNTLQEYGLNFASLNLLNEHGLVISDYNSWYEWTPCLAMPGDGRQAICIPLGYQGRYWILMPTSHTQMNKKLRIDGVALTQSGKELSTIVKVEPADKYSKALAQWFEKRGFRMVEVADGNPLLANIDEASMAP